MKKHLQRCSHAAFGDCHIGIVKRRRRKPKPFERRWFRVSMLACFAALSVNLSGSLFSAEEYIAHTHHHPHTHTDFVETPSFGGSDSRAGLRSVRV